MPWVKLDDSFFDNATNRRLGPAGRDLFVAGLAYCAKGLTDGRIDKADLPLVLASAQAKKPTVTALVGAGRWLDRGDHYEVDQYLTYQPSKAQVTAEREAARERQRRARAKGGESRRDIDRESPGTDAVSNGPPGPSRPGSSPPTPPQAGGHDGTHTNCRECGTNRRGKPEPPPQHRLPPNHAPEGIADLEHHASPRIPDDVAETGREQVRELLAQRNRTAS